MNATDEAAQWFIAQRTGELSPEESERFARWLTDSAANLREYLAVAELWGGVPTASSVKEPSHDDLLESLRSATPVPILRASLKTTETKRSEARDTAPCVPVESSAKTVRPSRRGTTRARRWWPSRRVAASVASTLVVVFGALAFWAEHSRHDEFATQRGNSSHLRCPMDR